jgi:predicted ATPase/DNA-binding winged helix-turn-helix (wHTH) protein
MIQLGVIELEPSRRRLSVRGETVELGPRAFDVLEDLILAGGAVVTKEALLRRLWRGLVVEENNLQVQVSAIRKALGDHRDLIQTVPRIGYRFMVEHLLDATGTDDCARDCAGDCTEVGNSGSGPTAAYTNLPAPVTELIGREQSTHEIIELLSARRILTLTGPGGIGKTRLSLEAGRRMLPSLADGVWLAELGSLGAPLLVAGTIGSAVGARIDHHAARHDEIAKAIGDRHLLLVLDNCEHLIDEVAQLVECIARTAPNARILATSREPLGVFGETVYAVPSLDVSGGSPLNGAPLPSSAVLFLARMRAHMPNVPEDAGSLGLVRALCERLDGIPLAIEIAAAQAPILGLEPLSALLDDRFRLMMDRGRTTLPRHRTLRATLDWSFDLLGEAEQVALCSFAVFAGGFTLDAALAVCSPDAAPMLAMGIVASLVRKSLIVADIDATGMRYRLLDTTRAYAAQKLREQGAWDRVALRHATFFAELLRTVQIAAGEQPREEQLKRCRRELDNVRAAIDWAFGNGRERELGIVLAARTAPVLFDFSLLEECVALADRALHALSLSKQRRAQEELTLLATRAAAVNYTLGPTEEAAAAWKRVQVLATQLGEQRTIGRAVWGLWTQKICAGEPEASLPYAHQRGGANSPYAKAIALLQHRKLGTTLHFMGDQQAARIHLEQIATQYDPVEHHFPTIGSRLDHGRAARVMLARVLWLQGKLDQASALNRSNVTESGRAAAPLLTVSALLDAAVPISLMLRQWQDAKRYCDELQRGLALHPVPIWTACAECFVEVLAIGSTPAPERIAVLEAKIERLRQTHYLTHLTMLLCVLADALGAAGQADAGLRIVDEALRTCERTGERWYVAELLRVRGELTLTGEGERAQDVAGRDFAAAIELANQQGALFWELRAATSLARLWRATSRAGAARARLREVYDRFTEGFHTVDLMVARATLRSLE